MKKVLKISFLFYCSLSAILITFSGFATSHNLSALIFLFSFLPVVIFLVFSFLKAIFQNSLLSNSLIFKFLTYYGFIIVSILVIMGFLNAQNFAQLLSTIFFLPLVGYFTFLVWPKKNKAFILQVKQTSFSTLKKEIPKTVILEEKPLLEFSQPKKEVFDFDRRKFLKLIGSAGLSVFFLSLFTKRAESAFFGSVPGPGTVSLKDTTGSQVDPAVKQPTDGYRITKIDDSSSPAYYGFVNKDGAWFIMQENNGTYLYSRGSANFSNNWNNREDLEYDYFDVVF